MMPTGPTTLLLLLALGALAVLTAARAMDTVLGWRHRGRAAVAALVVGAGVVALARASVAVQAAAGALLTAAAAAVVWHHRTRSTSTVARWGARSRRKAGVASTLDVARVASSWAMKRKATTVRPSLADLGWWARWRTATSQVAVLLCRVGGLRVWSSIEDVTLLFGGPRTGKTGWFAGRIIDAPGAAVVTSSRTDLHALTAGLRARRGPTYVFNPAGLGGMPSTITFDPLTGCADSVTAAQRAWDMLPGASGSNSERAYWTDQARRVLTALLHAAALETATMIDVLRWVAAPPDEARKEVTAILRRSPETAYADDAEQFFRTNERTRTSITSTMMPALGWLMSPAARAAASGATAFNVAELLRTKATIYILGAKDERIAALVCALTGCIARESRQIAARQDNGRLDPPLTLALDEAALISPVPLNEWTADMGGAGITIVAAFQSRAQMMDRWDETGARVIVGNAASIMVFGSMRERDDLTYWSDLTGERDEPVATTDSRGHITSRTVRTVPVVSASQLANLPRYRVLVFHRGMAPVIGRVRMAWTRRDVRAQAKVDRRAAQAVVAAAEEAARAAHDSPAAGWAGESPTRPVLDRAPGEGSPDGW